MQKGQYSKAYLYMRIVQSKLFIDHNYFQSIDLREITIIAFFSKFHFIRTFKQIYGYTPNRYLKQVRIEKAKMHLKGSMTIKEICYSVGFESVSSFIRLFKKLVGQTPEIYRQAYLQKKKKEVINPWQFIPACFSGM